jgi:hypothetical protein
VELTLLTKGLVKLLVNGRSEICDERQLPTDTVEKLRISPDGKFIYTVTISKFSYTGREPKLTISSDRTTGELTW